MTNEQYLYGSYFAMAAAGVGLAIVTALALARPNREATGGGARRLLGALLRRLFPTWLILAVLLGFMSVTYFDCSHGSYESIVRDRPHMIEKTQEQSSRILFGLPVALMVYGFGLIFALWARARQNQEMPGPKELDRTEKPSLAPKA